MALRGLAVSLLESYFELSGARREGKSSEEIEILEKNYELILNQLSQNIDTLYEVNVLKRYN